MLSVATVTCAVDILAWLIKQKNSQHIKFKPFYSQCLLLGAHCVTNRLC